MKIHKRTNLVDGEGKKLNRKIRRDENGLYVVNNGMKGYLEKSVHVIELPDSRLVTTTRRVAYYEGA